MAALFCVMIPSFAFASFKFLPARAGWCTIPQDFDLISAPIVKCAGLPKTYVKEKKKITLYQRV